MDYSHQGHTPHHAAPSTTSSAPAAAIIGPETNPNPLQFEISVPQGVGSCLTSPVRYNVAQCQAAMYAASYPATRTAAAGGAGLAGAYFGSINMDMEVKKQKLLETGVDANSIRTCSICNVACNSNMVFASHINSKKHISRVSAPTTQSVSCEICKVTCNTQDMYNNHVLGKKHNKKIRNLSIGDSLAAAISISSGTQTPPTNDNDQEPANASSQVEPMPKRKSKSVSKEDLETKKRKLLEGGVNGDSIRVCDLCNKVCNGPKVFEDHCRGHKHSDMVKKQEESLVGSAVACAAAAPGVVSD